MSRRPSDKSTGRAEARSADSAGPVALLTGTQLAFSADTVRVLWPHKWAGKLPGWEWDGASGLSGATWYSTYRSVDDERVRITVRGIARNAYAIWEGSVPRALGLELSRESEVRTQVERVGSLLQRGGVFAAPYLGRVDACCDVHDADGAVRAAAGGWRPHARTKYVEAHYLAQDKHGRHGRVETVFLRNGNRAVRVYDKFAESGEDRFREVTRVEYQMRTDWTGRMGLTVLGPSWDDSLRAAIEPLVTGLLARV